MTIFDAVRMIEDVKEFSKRYNIEVKMICIDFKKAFDTMSRDFLFCTLSATPNYPWPRLLNYFP